MGAAAFWEKVELAVRAEMEEQGKWFAAGIDRLRAGVAEIAAAKSSQQFGREEEKE
jgi:hypothetical protein